MQTLMLTPHYTVTRETLAPRRLGLAGSKPLQAFGPWDRPAHAFTLRSVYRSQEEAEYLWSFAVVHQGDTPFWWDGGPYSTVTTPQYVGTGDGARTQFFLPQRHITGTPAVYVTEVLADPQPTLDAAPGLLTFATPVADSAVLTGTYTCRYKLVFELADDTLLSEEQFVSGLYRYEGIRLREAVP